MTTQPTPPIRRPQPPLVDPSRITTAEASSANDHCGRGVTGAA